MSTPARWIIYPKPLERSRTRIFCMPPAGGGVSAYRAWPARLEPAIEVAAVRLPGRESRARERPLRTLPDVVMPLCDAIAGELTRPYAVFGHCTGALIAFELVREIRRRELPPPAVLFVSGFPAPQLLAVRSPKSELPVRESVELLRTMGATPPALLENDQLLAIALPALRADYSLMDSYSYTADAPLDLPITAFAGTSDAEVSMDQVRGWSSQSSRSFQVHTLQSDHFFIWTCQEELLAIIRRVAA